MMAPVGQWNKWFPIHEDQHVFSGATVTAQWATPHHLDLFVTDAQGVVQHTWWEAGAKWQRWVPIPSQKMFKPGAVITALWATNSHLDLFITDNEGGVWSTFWEPEGGWRLWFPIYSVTHFAAGATVTALWANSGHLDLFITDKDGGVWSTWWESATQWTNPWFPIDPKRKFKPGAVVTALWANKNHLDLFISDSGGRVWSTWWESDPKWKSWFTIHPEVTFTAGAKVTALWTKSGHLDLFVTDQGGAVSTTWWEQNQGWQPWDTIHPEGRFQPGADVTAVWANKDHLDLFITGADGTVNSIWWQKDVGYSQWFKIRPEEKFKPGASVTAVWANEDHLDLFVTDDNGVVWSCFYADTASPDWALLANEGFERQSMKSTYFFAGNWRCCKGWQNWFPVRPEIKKFDPQSTATALWANETHLDLFSTDHDGVVWTTWSEIGGNGWQNWIPIDAGKHFYPGAPVTAVWANKNHLDLFVTDEYGLVWRTWWEAASKWQPWSPVRQDREFQPGGEITALWANEHHLDVFVSDSHGTVWTTWSEDGIHWREWFEIHQDPPHNFKPGGKVTALWANSNHLDLFMTDLHGTVWSTWWESGPKWQPWSRIRPETSFHPGAQVTALWANSSHLDLFITDGNGAVQSTWWEDGGDWQPWDAIHSEIQFQPGAPVTAQWADANHLDLFITDKNGLTWSTWWESAPKWQTWFNIHPEPAFVAGALVTAALSSGRRVDLFVLANDGTIWNSFYPGESLPKFYDASLSANEDKYTRHPKDARDLGWSEDAANRNFAVDKMIEGGVNVITMSYWGEPGSDRWIHWAPMYTATGAHDELFTAAVGKNILILPAIESADATYGCGGSSPAYQFASDFPGTDSNPAPQLVLQLKDLIQRYLKQPLDPAWPGKWAQMYDRQGEKRYAVNILHVASNLLENSEDERFANGFDRVADRVFEDTGVRIGFTLDLLPSETTVNNGGCGQDDMVKSTFRASAKRTGPWLRQQASFLAVQAFIPQIYRGSSDVIVLFLYKWLYLGGWIIERLPVILDADPGYDAHLMWENAERWGNDDHWRGLLSTLRALPVRGIVFNTWNGYTEGYAMVPTQEDGDANFRWMQEMFN